MTKLQVYQDLSSGGEWLGAARRWMQSNIHKGDSLCWNDSDPVIIPFCKLEELALKVAIAVEEDRRKR